MTDFLRRIRSELPGAAWPAVPNPDGAHALALQFQLELSQFYSPGQLQQLQYLQLDTLLRHAHATVPYYRERWRGLYDPAVALTPETYARLPVLTRGTLQQNFEALKSAAPPAEHGAPYEIRTSGSTGMPARVLKTPLERIMWQGAMLRDLLWRRRDLAGKVAAIRHGLSAAEGEGWDPVIDAVLMTGPVATLPIATDVRTQLEWLEAQRPSYLLTYPSNLAELALQSLARGIRLPELREACTFGEVLSRETRDLCREAWGVAVTDTYSANEVGYIALQCPVEEHYHVQSEFVMVEVVDMHGKPCQPGQVGLVVVTELHNAAMPLVRYVLGDYAEVGAPCSCGRGLPVLSRIVGRGRNMMRLPDGSTRWPSMPLRALTKVAPLRQFRLVQHSLTGIEVQMLTDRPLTGDEETALRDAVRARLGYPFDVRFARVDRMERGAGQKFEDFVCQVT